eukprot:Rhum_TRINITY_DN16931_c0_g1::Rhum_TRINITY_DN16931_c0_g1_i1::g.164845::m.164845
MAIMTMRWLEGVTGLDITGEQSIIESLREVEPSHVRGDDDADDVLACDQILMFMEKELWKVQDGVDRETMLAMMEHKQAYINGLNGAAFKNSQLVSQLSLLAEARARHAKTRDEAVRLEIVNLKLDVADTLAARLQKTKETQRHADALRDFITQVQLSQLGSHPPPMPSCDQQPPVAATAAAAAGVHEGHRSPAARREHDASALKSAGVGDRVVRRFISDSEVKGLLRKRAYE